jgi:hypothetical protein
MAILANGVNITQERYEFALRYPDGHVEPRLDLRDAQNCALSGWGQKLGAEIVMRVVYVTPWQETDIEHS